MQAWAYTASENHSSTVTSSKNFSVHLSYGCSVRKRVCQRRCLLGDRLDPPGLHFTSANAAHKRCPYHAKLTICFWSTQLVRKNMTGYYIPYFCYSFAHIYITAQPPNYDKVSIDGCHYTSNIAPRTYTHGTVAGISEENHPLPPQPTRPISLRFAKSNLSK